MGYATLKRLLDHRGAFQKGDIAPAIGEEADRGVLPKDFFLERGRDLSTSATNAL